MADWPIKVRLLQLRVTQQNSEQTVNRYILEVVMLSHGLNPMEACNKGATAWATSNMDPCSLIIIRNCSSKCSFFAGAIQHSSPFAGSRD